MMGFLEISTRCRANCLRKIMNSQYLILIVPLLNGCATATLIDHPAKQTTATYHDIVERVDRAALTADGELTLQLEGRFGTQKRGLRRFTLRVPSSLFNLRPLDSVYMLQRDFLSNGWIPAMETESYRREIDVLDRGFSWPHNVEPPVPALPSRDTDFIVTVKRHGEHEPWGFLYVHKTDPSEPTAHPKCRTFILPPLTITKRSKAKWVLLPATLAIDGITGTVVLFESAKPDSPGSMQF